ncbi:velvet factor, partial [Coemansia mojavensis]
MQVQLLDAKGEATIKQIKGHKAAAMAGSMVSPLHSLRDMSSVHGAYFVFSDLSVRMEGTFCLRFDLFEMVGEQIFNRASIVSNVFCVYSPKRFPGMMESTQLSRLFAEQGLRIRIRTE